ncbi:MAG: 4a-hydroxytetrahydrobiopterin dehydratase [Armatimonadetes bacterium]|nr:4a-hydroxytetrahydrobiopterin dehydratase [Armatimonadota bacterium]
MNLSYDALSQDEIVAQQATVPDWNVASGVLSREFETGSYLSNLQLTNLIADLAEKLNHHPDILLSYSKVTVTLTTHDASNKLTSYDFELARQINAAI